MLIFKVRTVLVLVETLFVSLATYFPQKAGEESIISHRDVSLWKLLALHHGTSRVAQSGYLRQLIPR